MKWRILKSGKLNPAENMAIDEAILNGIIQGRPVPTIRFYGWEPATVSCGYHQSAEKEVDFAALKEFGFGFVRRPTGGRLVLHNEEVTYSVIAPTSGKFSGNVYEIYAEISKVLASGFSMLGIEVDFEKGEFPSKEQRQVSNPCFSSSSRFELSYKRKKIVGSAQLRKEKAFLQHGSILLNHNQSKIAFILPNLKKEKKEKLALTLCKKTISINEIVSPKISFSQACDIFEQAFKKSWPCNEFCNIASLEEFEKSNVTHLVNNKYASNKWNKRK